MACRLRGAVLAAIVGWVRVAAGAPSLCPSDAALHASPVPLDPAFHLSRDDITARTLASTAAGDGDWIVLQEPAVGTPRAQLNIQLIIREDAGFTCHSTGDVVVDSTNAPYTCTDDDVLTPDKRRALRNAMEAQTAKLASILTAQRYAGEPPSVALNGLASAAGVDGSIAARCSLNLTDPTAPFTFAYPEDGIATDVVVYVAAAPMRYDNLGVISHAYGHPCYFAAHTHRPVVGFVNYAPHMIDAVDAAYTNTVALHELVHALAWHPSLMVGLEAVSADAPAAMQRLYLNAWEPYRLRDGSTARVLRKRRVQETLLSRPRPTGLDAFTRSPTIPYDVSVLATPAVVAAARAHYACDRIDGVEIEDHTFGRQASTEMQMAVHWEKRVAKGDLMNSVVDAGAVLSPMTAAFFEDTGFYAVTSAGRVNVDVLVYGNAAGCRFVELSCSGWHVDPPAQSDSREAAHYSCLPQFSATVVQGNGSCPNGDDACATGCPPNGDAGQFYRCNAQRRPAEDPVPREYVPSLLYSGGGNGVGMFATADAAQEYGGCDPLMDYCYMWEATGTSCASPVSNATADCRTEPCRHFTEPSASSMCYFTDMRQAWLDTHERRPRTATYSSTCLPTRCFTSIFNETALEVTIGASTAVCYRGGQLVGPGANPTPGEFATFFPIEQSQLTGSVLCPDPVRACRGRVIAPTGPPQTGAPGTPTPEPPTPAPAVDPTNRTAWHVGRVLVNDINPCVLPMNEADYFTNGTASSGKLCVLPVWEGQNITAIVEGGPVDVRDVDNDMWVGLGRDRNCLWTGMVEFARVVDEEERANPTASTLRFTGGLPWWLQVGKSAWFCVRSKSTTTVTTSMQAVAVELQGAAEAAGLQPLGWEDASGFNVRSFAQLPARVTVGDRLAVRVTVDAEQLDRLVGRRFTPYYAFTAVRQGLAGADELLLQGFTREPYCTMRVLPIGRYAVYARLYLSDGVRVSTPFAAWSTVMEVGNFVPGAADLATGEPITLDSAMDAVRAVLSEVEARTSLGTSGPSVGETVWGSLGLVKASLALPDVTMEAFSANGLSPNDERRVFALSIEAHERLCAVIHTIASAVALVDERVIRVTREVLLAMSRRYQYVSPLARAQLLDTLDRVRARLVFDVRAQAERQPDVAVLFDQLDGAIGLYDIADNVITSIQAAAAGQTAMPSLQSSTGILYSEFTLVDARRHTLRTIMDLTDTVLLTLDFLMELGATASAMHEGRYTRTHALVKYIDDSGVLRDPSLSERQRAEMRVGFDPAAGRDGNTSRRGHHTAQVATGVIAAPDDASVFGFTTVARSLYSNAIVPELYSDVVVVQNLPAPRLTLAQQQAALHFEVDVYVDLSVTLYPTLDECQCYAEPELCGASSPVMSRVFVKHRAIPSAQDPNPPWVDILTRDFDARGWCRAIVADLDAHEEAKAAARFAALPEPPPPPPPPPTDARFFVTYPQAQTRAYELAEVHLFAKSIRDGVAPVGVGDVRGVYNLYGSAEGAASVANAFDGNASSTWEDPGLGDVAVEFARPTLVSRYTFAVPAGRVYRYPVRWVLEGASESIADAAAAGRAADALSWTTLHAVDQDYIYPTWDTHAEAGQAENFTAPTLPVYLLTYPAALAAGLRSYRLRITKIRGTLLRVKVRGTGEVAAMTGTTAVDRVVRESPLPQQLDVYSAISSNWDTTDWNIVMGIAFSYLGLAVLLTVAWINDRLRSLKTLNRDSQNVKEARLMVKAARLRDQDRELGTGGKVNSNPPAAAYPRKVSKIVKRKWPVVMAETVHMLESSSLGLFLPSAGRDAGSLSSAQKLVVLANSALLCLAVACVLYRPSLSEERSLDRVMRLGVLAVATAMIGVPLQHGTVLIFCSTKLSSADLESKLPTAGEAVTYAADDPLKHEPILGGLRVHIAHAKGLPQMFPNRHSDVFYKVAFENKVYRSPTVVESAAPTWHCTHHSWFPVRSWGKGGLLRASSFVSSREASMGDLLGSVRSPTVAKEGPSFAAAVAKTAAADRDPLKTEGNMVVTFYADYHSVDNAQDPIATAVLPVQALRTKQSRICGELDEWYALTVHPKLEGRVPSGVLPRVRIVTRVEKHQFPTGLIDSFKNWRRGDPLPTPWVSRALARHIKWVEMGYVGHPDYFAPALAGQPGEAVINTGVDASGAAAPQTPQQGGMLEGLDAADALSEGEAEERPETNTASRSAASPMTSRPMLPRTGSNMSNQSGSGVEWSRAFDLKANWREPAPLYRALTWAVSLVPVGFVTGTLFLAAEVFLTWREVIGKTRGEQGRDYVVGGAAAAAGILLVLARFTHRWVTLATSLWLTMAIGCLISGPLPAIVCLGGGVCLLGTVSLWYVKWPGIRPLIQGVLVSVLFISPCLMSMYHTTVQTPWEAYIIAGASLFVALAIAYVIVLHIGKSPYAFLLVSVVLTCLWMHLVLINPFEVSVVEWPKKGANRQQVLEIIMALGVASLYLIFFVHHVLCGPVVRGKLPRYVQDWVYALAGVAHAGAVFSLLTYLVDQRQDGKHEGIFNAALFCFWFQVFVVEPIVKVGGYVLWKQLLHGAFGGLCRFLIAMPIAQGWEDLVPCEKDPQTPTTPLVRKFTRADFVQEEKLR